MTIARAVGAALASALVSSTASAEEGPPRPVVDRLGGIAGAVGACWNPPLGLRVFEDVAVTVRFALRRDGSLIGPPRVSFAGLPVESVRLRDILGRSAIEAVQACTPVPVTAPLGQAIAGRVFSIRFIYRGPRGRGA